MNLQIIDSTKKKNFIADLEYLGIKKIPYLLMRSGHEKLRAYSGNLSTTELFEISRKLPVEFIGLYFGKQLIDKRNGQKESRLTIDALHMLKDQVSHNILILSDLQQKEWFSGNTLQLTPEQTSSLADVSYPFIAIKHQEDFIGIGKLNNEKTIVSNFLPKERRVKN